MELEDLLVFTFSGATREQSPPAPDGHYVPMPEAGHIGMSGQSAVLRHTRNSIPHPPNGFRCDDLVEVGIALYADAASIPVHALKFAYAFLTLIEDRYGKQQVAKALSIDKVVLSEFRDLISRGGDGVSARMTMAERRLAITAERGVWLMLVFRELIRRHGQVNAGANSLPQFAELCPGTDADFPHRPKRIAQANPSKTP